MLLILWVAFGMMNAAAQEMDTVNTYSRETGDSLPYSFANYDTGYPVLYDSYSQNNLVESVSFLNGNQLTSTPSAFITNALSGRMSGVYTKQNSGEPGNDGADLTLRGRTPIILVDGIPRTLTSINPEQIASITVLKDALSTALLGIRGMNGAVLITTKKGKQAKGYTVDLTAQGGIASPVKLPQPLSAYNYATLYNEALTNDGKSPLYTQSDLEHYKNHTDPYGYPDVNWYDQTLNKEAPFSRYTLDAEGSAKALHYFVSLDYLNQQGLLKGSSLNTYNTNTDYTRYIFRSNVNVDLTKRTSMFLNVFGSIQKQNEPGAGMAGIWNAMLSTPANAYPVLNPNDSLGGNVSYNNNIYGQSILSGYTKTFTDNGFIDLGLKRNMDDILKGWWIQGMVSYNVSLTQLIDRSKNFATFQMMIDPATNDTTYNRYGTKTDQKNTSTISDRENQFYIRASTGYTHHWNDNDLNVLLMYNQDSYTTTSNLPQKYMTFGGRINYNIQNKYIIEAAGSYSGDSYYAPGHRFGVFPAVGAAWNLNNENFFPKNSFINTLKLRVSYGLNGNSVAGYYDYIERYGGATGYYFGTSAASNAGRAFKQQPNTDTWEKAWKLNAGIDMGFAEKKGMLSFDYYHNKLTDLKQARERNSALIGWGSDIVENLGKDLYSGLEITANWTDRLGSFKYYVSANLTVSGSKILFMDEPAYPYPWMQETGQKVGQIYGYVADGFVSTAGEGPVVEGYSSVPGDIKYKDLNNDGVINQYDQEAIGTKKPLLFYGAALGGSWKHFSLSILLQGVANRSLLLTGAKEWEFQNDGKGQAWKWNMDRWTPQTASSATYPRLTAGTNVNNDVPSSFWIQTGSYMRLKNVELSYSFNNVGKGKVKLRQLRLFINGLNLLTLSKFKEMDPEVLSTSYPLERVVNGGISIKF